MRLRRNAFTTVELLVVIGTLVVLAALVVVGFGRLTGDAQEKATRTTLKNLQAMMGEYTLKAPLTVYYRNQPNLPLLAPTSVSQGDDRYGEAVVLTQRVMRLLLTSPENRKALGNIPADQLMPLVWSDKVEYQIGDIVIPSATDRQAYRCRKAGRGPRPPSGNWERTTEQAPILLDGWGNPIIFVPPAGLAIKMNQTDNADALRVVKSPTNRPFFASAGLDVQFRGDPQSSSGADREKAVLDGAADNLYSFEE